LLIRNESHPRRRIRGQVRCPNHRPCDHLHLLGSGRSRCRHGRSGIDRRRDRRRLLHGRRWRCVDGVDRFRGRLGTWRGCWGRGKGALHRNRRWRGSEHRPGKLFP
jgi:hypothetical protein